MSEDKLTVGRISQLRTESTDQYKSRGILPNRAGQQELKIIKLQEEITRLKGEVERYKGALEFYADPISYQYLSRGCFRYHKGIDLDKGRQARQALEQLKDSGDDNGKD